MHLTLRQLQYFVATVSAGSITRAAERLHVAPTALSLQIKAIEDQFGVSLLDRHSRGINVTSRGTDLYERSQGILAQVAAAEAALRGGADLMPKVVRLGAPPAIARLIGAEAVLSAAIRFPGVTVDLLQGWSASLEQRLRSGEMDIVIGFDLVADDQVRVTAICEDEFVFAGAPGVAGPPGPVALADILGANLVFYGSKSVGWRSICEAAAAAGLPPPRENQVGSIDVWRGLLCRGAGCTVTSYSAIAEEHTRGQVIVRPITGRPIRRTIAIAHRHDAGAEQWQNAFCDFISDLTLRGLSQLEGVS